MKRMLRSVARIGILLLSIVGLMLYLLSFRRSPAIWYLKQNGSTCGAFLGRGELEFAVGHVWDSVNCFNGISGTPGVQIELRDYAVRFRFDSMLPPLDWQEPPWQSIRAVGGSGGSFPPQGDVFPLTAFRPADVGFPFSRTVWQFGGIAYGRDFEQYDDGVAALINRKLLLPSWFLGLSLLAGIVLPMRSILREFIRRRRVKGGCRACGYNLTGNTSGICPECGTAVSSKPEAVA